MSKAVLALSISILAAGHARAAGNVSTTLSIQVNPQALMLVVNPSKVVSLPCETLAGAVVSQASASGGNGNPVTFSLVPPNATMKDFVIDPVSGVVSVATGGIAPADCNKTFNFTVTGTQP